jgi:hypothetical protein
MIITFFKSLRFGIGISFHHFAQSKKSAMGKKEMKDLNRGLPLGR